MDGWMDPMSASEEAQRPTGSPVGALDFPHAPKGATFSFLAPPVPGAVLVNPILLICTAGVKKPTYPGDMKGCRMMRCKALGKCK